MMSQAIVKASNKNTHTAGLPLVLACYNTRFTQYGGFWRHVLQLNSVAFSCLGSKKSCLLLFVSNKS